MAESVKVAIVGAGIIGCSIAYYLAKHGCTDVMVFERASSPATGATPHSAGGIRAQFSTAANIRLCKLSIERYERYHEEVSPNFHFHQVGYLILYVTPGEWEAAQANVALQRSLGLDVQLWTPQQVADYVPGLVTGDLAGGTFHQRDGLAEPYEITMGYYEGARAAGIPFFFDQEITHVDVDEATSRVLGIRSAEREIRCEVLLDCAGPWAPSFGKRAGLDIPAKPVRRQLVMTQPFDAVFPTFPMVVDLHSGGYLRPETGGLMLGWADQSEPESFSTTFDWDWAVHTIELCAERFPPLLEAEILRGWAHLYTMTPDCHPILGPHPEMPNFLMALGFSGHGVMSAPATAIALAEYITTGRSQSLDLHPFRLSRFAEGEMHVERNVI